MDIKEVNKVGNRGIIFTFADNISVYLIGTKHYWFLCDTHLGPDSMEYIKQYMALSANNKDIIIFNSHADWDHIWGNCAFPATLIIGHEMCRKRMCEIGQFDLARLTAYHCGTINLVLPNVTFSDKLAFEEDELAFIYAPGHTIDSAVCFDRQDSVLFLGDLVECPIPYLDSADLSSYLITLDFIKGFPARVKVSSHSGIIDDLLIDRNIAYIKDIMLGNPIDPLVYQECPHVHNFNVNNRLFLSYENMAREKFREHFDYGSFRGNFGDLEKIAYEDLQAALERYFANVQI